MFFINFKLKQVIILIAFWWKGSSLSGRSVLHGLELWQYTWFELRTCRNWQTRIHEAHKVFEVNGVDDVECQVAADEEAGDCSVEGLWLRSSHRTRALFRCRLSVSLNVAVYYVYRMIHFRWFVKKTSFRMLRSPQNCRGIHTASVIVVAVIKLDFILDDWLNVFSRSAWTSGATSHSRQIHRAALVMRHHSRVWCVLDNCWTFAALCTSRF